MPTSSKIKRIETAGEVSLVLPRRTLPPPLRNFGVAALVVGLVFLLAAGKGVLGDDQMRVAALSLVELIAGCVSLSLGALLVFSHSVVRYKGPAVVISERAGPLCIRRRAMVADLSNIRVEELLPTGVTILSAEIALRGRRVLLFGYSKELLNEVANEILRQIRRPQAFRG